MIWWERRFIHRDREPVAYWTLMIIGVGVFVYFVLKGRHMLSQAGNVYARVALGFGVRDSTSGFRCYRRAVLEAVGLEQVRSNGYAFQIDMTYRAWKLGFRVREVPITFRERSLGASKMSRAIVSEALIAVGRWGLRDLVHRRRGPDARA